LLLYGYSSFSLEILEYCEPGNVIEREQYYLDLLKPEYNILKVAGSSLGSIQTEETKAKIRKAALNRSEETLTKLREHLINLNSSLEQLKHLEKLNSSPEQKARILKRSLPVMVTDLANGVSVEYESLRQAARELNTHPETIRRCIKAQKPFLDTYQITHKKSVPPPQFNFFFSKKMGGVMQKKNIFFFR
jgi:group I intron endonuclease